MTKDRDFRDGHLLHGAPRRLWLISTGNITNDDLLALVERNLEQVIDGLNDVDFVELESNRLILHG